MFLLLMQVPLFVVFLLSLLLPLSLLFVLSSVVSLPIHRFSLLSNIHPPPLPSLPLSSMHHLFFLSLLVSALFPLPFSLPFSPSAVRPVPPLVYDQSPFSSLYESPSFSSSFFSYLHSPFLPYVIYAAPFPSFSFAILCFPFPTFPSLFSITEQMKT